MAVRFQGDPVIKETGSGKGPDIPLNKNIQATQVEMLTGEDEQEPDEDSEEEAQVEYSRERTAARIGTPVEEAQKVVEVEEQLDGEDVVPLIFSKPIQLQDKGLMHRWGAGVHLVPVSIAGATPKEMHWWLKHNRVRRGGKAMPNPNKD